MIFLPKFCSNLNVVVFRYFIFRNSSSAKNEVRVRFAPSPTGFLHLGGLRTALYNYLYSKSHNGTFVLRIEDTDQTRLVNDAIEKLEFDLKWAGISPDESPSKGGSYGPYLQSQRLSLYKKEVQKLLDNGSAYYCFCNDRRLDLLKRDAIRRREVPKYDNRCRYLSPMETQEKLDSNSSYCIRFKLEPFLEPIKDMVYGNVTHDVAAIEGDPIILKSDGYPTYHLANVVDDHYMEITHVLRGVEWQPSTAKHLLLYKAFNWIPPKYAHLPLLMNEDGTKLSKRNNNVTVESYRNERIYPIALINFIISSGGGFVKDEENDVLKVKQLDELIQKFRLELVHPHNCQVQYERLNQLNRLVLKEMMSNDTTLNNMANEVKIMVKEHFGEKEKLGNLESKFEHERIRQILKWSTNRIHRLKDLVEPEFVYLWIPPTEDVIVKQKEENFKILDSFINNLEKIDDFNETFLSKYLKSFLGEQNVGYASFMKFLRICLSGLTKGPGVVEIMINLGKQTVLQRLERASSIYKKITNK